MKYKRIFMTVIILIFVMLTGTACNKSDESETTQKIEQKEKKEKKKKDKKNKKNEEKADKAEKKENKSKKPHICLRQMSESHYDFESGDFLYKIKGVKPELREDEGFEALRKALEEYSQTVDMTYSQTKDTMDSFSVEEREDRAQGFGNTVRKDLTDAYVMRADKSMVSILYYNEADYTGAGSRYYRSAINFDTKTGETLSFTDVVSDAEGFFKLVDDIADSDYPESDITKPSEYVSEMKDNDYADLVWTSSPEGVTVYFDTGVLGAFTDGAQVITVYFEGNDDMFSAEYAVKDKEYAFPIVIGNMPLHLDIDGDGEREPVHVNNIYEQNEDSLEIYTTGLEVFAGDESVSYEGYEGSTYIVKKGGKYYMYIFRAAMEDYITLSILDLSTMEKNDNNDQIIHLGEREYKWEQEEDGAIDKDTSLSETLTDPESVFMDEVVFVITTLVSEREWSVGEAAVPEPKEDRAKTNYGYVLHTLQEINCEEVDENGKVKGTSTIPEDSYILIMYSDNSSYVDVRIIDKDAVEEYEWEEGMKHFTLLDESLMDYDGDCYRITVDSEGEYAGSAVDGVYVGDLFEGIIFGE